MVDSTTHALLALCAALLACLVVLIVFFFTGVVWLVRQRRDRITPKPAPPRRKIGY
jgi:hypothetical protein